MRYTIIIVSSILLLGCVSHDQKLEEAQTIIEACQIENMVCIGARVQRARAGIGAKIFGHTDIYRVMLMGNQDELDLEHMLDEIVDRINCNL